MIYVLVGEDVTEQVKHVRDKLFVPPVRELNPMGVAYLLKHGSHPKGGEFYMEIGGSKITALIADDNWNYLPILLKYERYKFDHTIISVKSYKEADAIESMCACKIAYCHPNWWQRMFSKRCATDFKQLDEVLGL